MVQQLKRGLKGSVAEVSALGFASLCPVANCQPDRNRCQVAAGHARTALKHARAMQAPLRSARGYAHGFVRLFGVDAEELGNLTAAVKRERLDKDAGMVFAQVTDFDEHTHPTAKHTGWGRIRVRHRHIARSTRARRILSGGLGH